MNKTVKLIHGWGINDVDHRVCEYKTVNGKQKLVWICPYYEDWKQMLRRCFDKNYQEKYPTYKNCTVCEEWKYLSNFIKWVDSQPNRDWQNCSLDKDLLIVDNNYYCPDRVVYIPESLNNFTLCRSNGRGDYMLGVSSYSYNSTKKYKASCNSPSSGEREYIGLFSTEVEAHKAWQAKKHEYALQLADEQDDPRVAKALSERYAPDKDWTNK